MDPRVYRAVMAQTRQYLRAAGPEPILFGRKMLAGKICGCCRVPLPEPHTDGRKICSNCAGKHLVYMCFHRSFGWHCQFITHNRQALPKKLTFGSDAKLREIAKRGNGVIDSYDQDGLDIAIDCGRGSILLRLNDEQYQALGGVL